MTSGDPSNDESLDAASTDGRAAEGPSSLRPHPEHPREGGRSGDESGLDVAGDRARHRASPRGWPGGAQHVRRASEWLSCWRQSRWSRGGPSGGGRRGPHRPFAMPPRRRRSCLRRGRCGARAGRGFVCPSGGSARRWLAA